MAAIRYSMAFDRAAAIIDGFADRRVVVVGDLMLDRYLWGTVHRISPEAPVPVVNVERETTRLGGGANVAANVRALGARPALVGVVGDDAAAQELTATMRAAGISDAWLTVDATRPTTRKTRVMAHNQQVVRVDQEDASPIDATVTARVFAHFEAALDGAGAVIVSDYGKGVVIAELVTRVLEASAAAGVPVCVDPKESHFDTYRPVSVITPNLFEASQAMSLKVQDETSLEAVGFGLLDRLGCPAVLVTRGEHGMSLFEPGDQHTHLPAVTQHVYDVTGAGDTVVSVYATALAAGADHKLAAAISNHAAGLVIRAIGTASASPSEILDSIRAVAHPSASLASDRPPTRG